MHLRSDSTTPRRHRRRGANAVEFGMIALPLTLIVIGTMEYGWLLFTVIMLDSATREGAREASRTDGTDTQIADAGYAASNAFWDSLGLPADPTFAGTILSEGDVRMVRMDGVLNPYKGLAGLAPTPPSIASHITVRHEVQD